jgi:hypothetical protein
MPGGEDAGKNAAPQNVYKWTFPQESNLHQYLKTQTGEMSISISLYTVIVTSGKLFQ